MFKKIGIYFAFLASGLFLGYIIFLPENTALTKPSSLSSDAIGRWTCSMHPEIDGAEAGSCPLCNMDLVYTDTQDSNELSTSQFRMTKEAVALANVETSIVSMANVENIAILVSGKIKSNTETDRVQTTLLDGRIDNFYVGSIGKRVRKGQQIGIMYSPELYLAQDKLLSSVSYKEKNMKLYLAARNTLGLWKMTDAQIDELIRSKTPLKNFPLYSDVNGTVTEIFASEGQYFKQGDVLFKTSDFRTVWAEFDAYETQLNFLEIGQEVVISSATLNPDGIKAKIAFIEPVINEIKRTATVRVVIPNRDNLLKPGMIVNAKISQLKSDNQMITVPKSAVLWTGKRSLVYKQISEYEPIFEAMEVVLGQRLSDYYEVLNGLSVGDIIVSEGTFTVDAAAQLNGTTSMMSSRKIEIEVNTNTNTGILDEGKNNSTLLNMNRTSKNYARELVRNYILLKDAFVSSDSKTIRQNTQVFLDVLQGPLDQVNTHDFNKISAVVKGLEKIRMSQNLVSQRKAFKQISEIMIGLASRDESNGSTLYVQHCDCADNNKGASWLSFQEQIKNPYFGDEMLSCGRIENTIQ